MGPATYQSPAGITTRPPPAAWQAAMAALMAAQLSLEPGAGVSTVASSEKEIQAVVDCTWQACAPKAVMTKSSSRKATGSAKLSMIAWACRQGSLPCATLPGGSAARDADEASFRKSRRGRSGVLGKRCCLFTGSLLAS